MPIPTVTEVEEFKEDLDDAEAIVNGTDTVLTRLGGYKKSLSQVLALIGSGNVTAYSAATTYTEVDEWIEESGIIYRPLPSALPIGPEAFDSAKWVVVQGLTEFDIGDIRQSIKTVSSITDLIALDGSEFEIGQQVRVTGGGTYQWNGSKFVNSWLKPKPRMMTMPFERDWASGGSQISLRSFSVRRDASGECAIDYPFWMPPGPWNNAGMNTYYVSPNGDDVSNDGLSPQEPFATIDKALSIAGAVDIVLEPGIHAMTWGDTTPAQSSASIRVWNNGRAVILTGERLGSWTNEGDGVYSNTLNVTSVCNVCDTRYYNDYGTPRVLEPLSNQSAVAAQDSGWAQVGTTIYVKLPSVNGVHPFPSTSATFLMSNDDSPGITSQSRFYIKGLEFWGGAFGFKHTGTSTVFLEDCDFAFSNDNGLDADNSENGIFMKNCRAFSNRADGFNYHNSSTSTPCRMIEYNCAAFDNGVWNDNGINNGSSLHDESIGIRVGGIYGNCYGPSIADVNSSRSWNVGVTALNSLTTSGVESSFEAWGATAGDATMWLDGCIGYGSTYDLYAHDGGTIYYRDFESDLNFFDDSGSGTIEEY